MKVIVKKLNGIIDSAFVKNNNELSFSLFINTVERRVSHDSVTSGHEIVDNEPGSYQITYLYYLNDGDEFDEVTFESENDAEINMMREYLAFEMHCKDQVWFLYVNEKVYK